MYQSELTDSARPSFERARRRFGDPLAYEQNWLYVMQACRRGGWYVRGEIGWVAVAKDYGGAGVHYAMVPMSSRLEVFLPRALSYLASNGVVVSTVKHIATQALGSLLKQDEFEMTGKGSSCCEPVLEDLSEDCFPQVVIDVSNLRWEWQSGPGRLLRRHFPMSSDLRDFRYQVRRFLRQREMETSKISERPISSVDSIETGKAIQNWLASIRERYSKEGRPRVKDFDSCFRAPIEAVTRLALSERGLALGRLIYLGDTPRALWIGSMISDGCLGVYVMIADSSIKGLADFTLFSILSYARENQARWVNVGGSELQSLYWFKSKPAGTGRENRVVHDLRWAPTSSNDCPNPTVRSAS